MSVDPTLIPTPTGFDYYLLWIDDDGNFSSAATAHPLVLNGGVYESNATVIPNGAYVTILVTNEADAEDLRITASPNPAATENVTLLLQGLKAGALQMAVHDMAGRILVDQRFDNGVASQQIKISDVLPEGVYIVTVKQGYKTAATRLVIVNTGAR